MDSLMLRQSKHKRKESYLVRNIQYAVWDIIERLGPFIVFIKIAILGISIQTDTAIFFTGWKKKLNGF